MYNIYTDGGCRNHGNVKGQHVRTNDKSAFAYLIIDKKNGKSIDGTKGYYGKTNNQMEVAGVIYALRRLIGFKPSNYQFNDVYHVISDSKYVDNAINQHWLTNWKKHDFTHGRHHKPVKNANEWRTLADLLSHFNHIDFTWTKGHAHNKGNIYVDHKLNHTMDRLTDK